MLDDLRGVGREASGDELEVEPGELELAHVDLSSGRISTVAGNGISGTEGDGGPPEQAQLQRPTGLALDASANLYIADAFGCRVRRLEGWDPELKRFRTITSFAGRWHCNYDGDGGPAAEASLIEPRDVAVDGEGDLLIADMGNDRIRIVHGAANVL